MTSYWKPEIRFPKHHFWEIYPLCPMGLEYLPAFGLNINVSKYSMDHEGHGCTYLLYVYIYICLCICISPCKSRDTEKKQYLMNIYLVVVLKIFSLHPFFGKWCNLTQFFSDGLKPTTSLPGIQIEQWKRAPGCLGYIRDYTTQLYYNDP